MTHKNLDLPEPRPGEGLVLTIHFMPSHAPIARLVFAALFDKAIQKRMGIGQTSMKLYVPPEVVPYQERW